MAIAVSVFHKSIPLKFICLCMLMLGRFLTLIFSVVVTTAFSQDLVKNFEIVLPKTKVPNSLYNAIAFMDSRAGAKEIGIVDVGLLRNVEATLVLKNPFQQLQAVMGALTDSSAKKGELLLRLGRFRFAETYGTRYCYFEAGLYAKTGDSYGEIASIDTVLVFRTASVNSMIQAESNIIVGFIATNLLRVPACADLYNLESIARIDSIEMHKIPVFNTETYVDGLYTSFKSFASQLPDQKPIVDANRDGTIETVRVLDSNGKKIKIRSKEVYAVVYNGLPYIATQYGYYILRKSADNNFYFTGDIKTVASQADVSGGQLALGLLGAALASAGNRETYVLMVDYRNGSFIHIKKIPKPVE